MNIKKTLFYKGEYAEDDNAQNEEETEELLDEDEEEEKELDADADLASEEEKEISEESY